MIPAPRPASCAAVPGSAGRETGFSVFLRGSEFRLDNRKDDLCRIPAGSCGVKMKPPGPGPDLRRNGAGE